MLLEEAPEFQGELIENSWQMHLQHNTHDARLGSGLIHMGPDGQPAVLFWGFVDDFMIHAPTHTKCGHALSTFMNFTLWLGIMCQKVKLKPPAQVQKYTGFLFDMTGIPTLHIPPDKCDHGLATIHFLKVNHFRCGKIVGMNAR